MNRILFVLLAGVAIAGCTLLYSYDLVKPSEVKNIHPDSLRWKYINGVLARMPVRDKEGILYWLDVRPGVYLDVETIEGERYYFTLESVKASDDENGLLGSNQTWRGYDTRSGADRTVFIREVSKVKVVARNIPARERILPK